MAHECHDREDLLRDARALVPRVQFVVPWGERRLSIFAGFRGDSLSVYFGPDPVYHFNAQGELRRAHVAGRLVKAEGGRLVAMQRVRTPRAVELRSERLGDAEQQDLLDGMVGQLAKLRAALTAGEFVLDGQYPAGGNAIGRLTQWIEHFEGATVAAAPRVG
jgi:hypothetical protein